MLGAKHCFPLLFWGFLFVLIALSSFLFFVVVVVLGFFCFLGRSHYIALAVLEFSQINQAGLNLLDYYNLPSSASKGWD